MRGFRPRADQLSDQVGGPGVALGEDRGVVAVADARVPHHVVEVADDLRGPEVGTAGGDQGLMHVQGDRERRAEAVESQVGLVEVHRVAGAVTCSTWASAPQKFGRPSIISGMGRSSMRYSSFRERAFVNPSGQTANWPMTEGECRRANKDWGKAKTRGPIDPVSAVRRPLPVLQE